MYNKVDSDRKYVAFVGNKNKNQDIGDEDVAYCFEIPRQVTNNSFEASRWFKTNLMGRLDILLMCVPYSHYKNTKFSYNWDFSLQEKPVEDLIMEKVVERPVVNDPEEDGDDKKHGIERGTLGDMLR